jgi:protein TonB
MGFRARQGWDSATGRRDRLLTLAGVGAVHLVILALLLTASPGTLQRFAEQPMQLITIRPPPPPPAPAKPSPKPAAAPAPKAAAPSPANPKAAPRKMPSVATVAVAAAADASLGASVGNGVSLGSIGTGLDLGGGGGGGLSRHATWIGGGISNSDYPVEAKRAGLQGVVDVRVIVMTDGHVRNCTIDHSSGSAMLDRLTCELVEQRLLFSPALDASGRPVEEVSGRRFRYVATRRR